MPFRRWQPGKYALRRQFSRIGGTIFLLHWKRVCGRAVPDAPKCAYSSASRHKFLSQL
jgi:hypothetical protein